MKVPSNRRIVRAAKIVGLTVLLGPFFGTAAYLLATMGPYGVPMLFLFFFVGHMVAIIQATISGIMMAAIADRLGTVPTSAAVFTGVVASTPLIFALSIAPIFRVSRDSAFAVLSLGYLRHTPYYAAIAFWLLMAAPLSLSALLISNATQTERTTTQLLSAIGCLLLALGIILVALFGININAVTHFYGGSRELVSPQHPLMTICCGAFAAACCAYLIRRWNL